LFGTNCHKWTFKGMVRVIDGNIILTANATAIEFTHTVTFSKVNIKDLVSTSSFPKRYNEFLVDIKKFKESGTYTYKAVDSLGNLLEVGFAEIDVKDFNFSTYSTNTTYKKYEQK
jgi:hypothetical protein